MCSCINKLILVIVNIIFLLAGAAIIAVSVWVIVSKNTLFQLVHVVTQGSDINDAALANYQNSTSTLLAAAYVILAFGVLSFVIGFCGCCGAIRESSCLLMVYAGAITVILLVEIAGGIAAGVFKSQITAQLKPVLIKFEQTRFLPMNLVLANTSSPNAVLSNYINYAQVMLGCCGVTNASDIVSNDTAWSRSNRMFNNRTLRVPVTCCKMNDGDKLLALNNWTSVSSYLVNPNCPYTSAESQNNDFNAVGCYDKLNSYIDSYQIAIIVVGIAVGLFEIICVVMACSMIQKIRNEGKQQHV